MRDPSLPLHNPFSGMPEYNCFGCDPNNATGLHLEFRLEGDEVVATWEPRLDMQGYPGVVHGGIQAALADEIAGWYVMAVLGTAGVTKSLEIEYLTPACLADGPFTLRARGTDTDQRNPAISVSFANAAGTVCARASCVYAIFSENVARRRFSFPGRDAILGLSE